MLSWIWNKNILNGIIFRMVKNRTNALNAESDLHEMIIWIVISVFTSDPEIIEKPQEYSMRICIK